MAQLIKKLRQWGASFKRLVKPANQVEPATHRQRPGWEDTLHSGGEIGARIYRASPIAICISTLAEGRILEFNDSFSRITGHVQEEIMGRTHIELGWWANPNDLAHLNQSIREQGSIRDFGTNLRTKEGGLCEVLCSADRIDLGGEPCCLLFIFDVSAHFREVRAGRSRLQALSKQLLEAQESERRRIARDLHDEIGQALTGLKFVLEAVAHQPADNRVPRLNEAQSLVNELIARVRDLSLELRPAMLDDLGLLPALLWHLERYTAQTQIRVDFGQSGLEKRFAPEIETAGYRIVQEALTNVARHAGETEVAVRLWADQNVLHLEVKDWGVGFDLQTAIAAGGARGLMGMRERAILLGGTLNIESVPGVGTRVSADLPLLDRSLERRRHERNDPAGG